MNTDNDFTPKELEDLLQGLDLEKYKYVPPGPDSPIYRKELEDKLPSQPVIISKLPSSLLINATVVSNRTVLIPFDDIYPECSFLTKGTTIPRCVCIAKPESCNRGNNCLGTLLTRLGNIASQQASWEYYVLYWKLYDGPNAGRIMGLMIRAKDSQMKLSILNPHALDILLNRVGTKFEIKMGLTV